MEGVQAEGRAVPELRRRHVERHAAGLPAQQRRDIAVPQPGQGGEQVAERPFAVGAQTGGGLPGEAVTAVALDQQLHGGQRVEHMAEASGVWRLASSDRPAANSAAVVGVSSRSNRPNSSPVAYLARRPVLGQHSERRPDGAGVNVPVEQVGGPQRQFHRGEAVSASTSAKADCRSVFSESK